VITTTSYTRCEECEDGPREVRIQRSGANECEFLSLCRECAGRIMGTSSGWEVFSVEQSVIDDLRGQIVDCDPLLIKCLLIVGFTWPAPRHTKAA
jgi:hypothetical protein